MESWGSSQVICIKLETSKSLPLSLKTRLERLKNLEKQKKRNEKMRD